MRLGSGQNFGRLLEHAWFDGFDWVALMERRMKPPYVPPSGVRADISESVLQEDPAALEPPPVDDATQDAFWDFGPMHQIGCDLKPLLEAEDGDAKILRQLGEPGLSQNSR